MSAYANQVKSYVERYQAEVGGDGLLDPHAPPCQYDLLHLPLRDQ